VELCMTMNDSKVEQATPKAIYPAGPCDVVAQGKAVNPSKTARIHG
jgi:hypothetical protein